MHAILRRPITNGRCASSLSRSIPISSDGDLPTDRRRRQRRFPLISAGGASAPISFARDGNQSRLRVDLPRDDDAGHLRGGNAFRVRRSRPFSSSSSSADHKSTPRRRDPMTRRPTKKCDPYGLGGNPLTHAAALEWMPTLDDGWVLAPGDDNDDGGGESGDEGGEDKPSPPPAALRREFLHPSYLAGARFLTVVVAAVATNNDHHPAVSLEKRIARGGGAWEFVVTVTCATPALGGLSYHDFHLASGIDVEAGRGRGGD